MIYEANPHARGICCAVCSVLLLDDESDLSQRSFQRTEYGVLTPPLAVEWVPGTESDGEVRDIDGQWVLSVGNCHLPYYCEECVTWDACMWCGEDFPNEDIEAHEAACQR